MKRSWMPEELVEHWSVTPSDLQAIGNKSGATRLGFVVALKYFQCEGRFPRGRQDVPWLIVSFLATQVKVPVEAWNDYRWDSRAATYHRGQIREALGFREVTSADGDAVVAWLLTEVVPTEQRPEHLIDHVIRHCKQQRIELPTDGRIQRFIDSALRQFEILLYARTTERLSTSVRDAMDALIRETEATLPVPSAPSAPPNWVPQTVQDLRTDPGRAGLATFLREVAKLRCIRAIGLPANLFAELPAAVLHRYRQRVDGERPSEVLAHPDPIRATLLAAWLVEREQEITDTLVDLLIQLMHRIVTRAEEKVETAYVTELKRVANKHTLLFRLANAALEHPEGTVREVLFPVVSEATLRELVAVWKASAPAYRQQVHTLMRASYRDHYRRLLPQMLECLEFRSNNDLHHPVMQALRVVTAYADHPAQTYPIEAAVPIDGVVSDKWREIVVETQDDGSERVNRVSYELSVLQALRERVRTKEIWVVGAKKFCNPEHDLPQDFDAKRAVYYDALHQPQDGAAFVADVQTQLHAALTALDASMSRNPKVTILKKNNGWIRVSPLTPQPAPKHLLRFKAEMGAQWLMTSLLDVVKETELRVQFTDAFTNLASREAMPRDVLQKRLLLCLFGLGTNIGLKRLCDADRETSYDDLRYVRRQYITKEQLRTAIAQVVNAIFRVRQQSIWGEGTTACASDSKKFGSWDQNLMTEWHVRYGGKGIMIYWYLRHEVVYVAVETDPFRIQPKVLPFDSTRTCGKSNLAV